MPRQSLREVLPEKQEQCHFNGLYDDLLTALLTCCNAAVFPHGLVKGCIGWACTQVLKFHYHDPDLYPLSTLFFRNLT